MAAGSWRPNRWAYLSSAFVVTCRLVFSLGGAHLATAANISVLSVGGAVGVGGDAKTAADKRDSELDCDHKWPRPRNPFKKLLLMSRSPKTTLLPMI